MEATKEFKPTKRVPREYQPEDRKFRKVRNYANSVGLTSARIYQKFQEGGLEIVSIDGVQYVELITVK